MKCYHFKDDDMMIDDTTFLYKTNDKPILEHASLIKYSGTLIGACKTNTLIVVHGL